MSPTTTASLPAHLVDTDFLRLTDSRSHYPHSHGSGLPLLVVTTDECEAVISLQGAQLLTFKTHTGKPLLWLSPKCQFNEGTALRGGVPVCLPWFAVNQKDPKKPKHGFARNKNWSLISSHLLPSGDAELVFEFDSLANDLFPYDFATQLRMTLGKSAKLELSIHNKDAKDFECSWALHSYFAVDRLRHVRVEGLDGETYLDNLDGLKSKVQQGEVTFPTAVDSAFLSVDGDVAINDLRTIHIHHRNCPSVVVWNPGSDAAQIADIGEGNEQGFICVERGAVFDSAWIIASGATKTASVEFIETEN